MGTPVSGGVTSAELARSLEQVAGEPSLAALELVEYSPRLIDGATARVALSLLSAALGRARTRRSSPTRSTDSTQSLLRSSRARGAASSSIPSASEPRKSGLR